MKVSEFNSLPAAEQLRILKSMNATLIFSDNRRLVMVKKNTARELGERVPDSAA